MKGKHSIFLLFILFLLICMISGCTYYLEQETPPGTVPPPPRDSDRSIQPPRSNPDENQSLKDARENSQMEVSKGTIIHFERIYAANKHPRIAVFLNRSLSDEIREWQSDSRVVISEEKYKEKSNTKQEKESSLKKDATSVSIEKSTDSKNRISSPDEQWMWSFENGFMQPFMQAKAKLIDRATILRLIATKTDKKIDAQSISVKQAEMEALKGYADIFVEILVSRAPSSLYGYELKATAKEVNTGRIIANVTSLRWKESDLRKRRVIATEKGYKVVEQKLLPPLEDIASNLAIELMNALIQTWNE